MGSDLHMNPPKKVYETHRVESEEDVIGWVIGAMANDYEITILPASESGWLVKVFKGKWI
jgi:hypothetical protein